MIKLFLFVFSFSPAILYAQNGNDTIVWSQERRLSWDDFKGNYDTAVYNRQYLATTFWKLRYQYKPVFSQRSIVFTIEAWFDAKKSWVRKRSRNSKSLLLHEQGHFDLAELLARQFRKQITETTFTNANYTDSIKTIFNKLLNKTYTQQLQYDKETSHGMHEEKQAYWQSFITTELNKLSLFNSKDVSAKLTR